MEVDVELEGGAEALQEANGAAFTGVQLQPASGSSEVTKDNSNEEQKAAPRTMRNAPKK